MQECIVVNILKKRIAECGRTGIPPMRMPRPEHHTHAAPQKRLLGSQNASYLKGRGISRGIVHGSFVPAVHMPGKHKIAFVRSTDIRSDHRKFHPLILDRRSHVNLNGSP